MRTWLVFALALGASLGSNGWASESHSVSVEVLAKATTSWDGATLPAYGEGQPEVTILRITIPPHTQLPMHTHPVINGGVLLRGQLTVETDDGERFHLEAGDTIVELIDKPHFGRNDGEVPAEIVVFYAGLEGEPITVVREDEGSH